MRVIITTVVFFLMLHAGPAEAFLDAPNCTIFWKAFVLQTDEADRVISGNPAGVVQDAGSTSDGGGQLLLALTIVPPSGQYLYGPESSEGLPTLVEVEYARLEAFPMTRMSAGQVRDLLETRGSPARVRPPAPVAKKETAFSSYTLAGSSDGNPDIYPGPVTFWTVLPKSGNSLGGLAARVTMSGLLCSPSSCTPAFGELNLAFSTREMETFPLAAAQDWWGALLAGESVYFPVPEEALAEAFFPAEDPAPYISGRKSPQDGLRQSEHAALFASLEPAFFNPDLEVEFLGEALLFGLLAGLLLNLMPCVLPVVSLKFSALMAVSSMTDKQEQARAFRAHCLIFAAGIMVWFVILAMLLGVAGWAWGEMFQQPWVIVLLGLVLFVLGLSLFGVFPLPILDFKVSSRGNPHWQAFASGLLATLLATPCSGPLLGGVLAWAIRQPLAVLASCVISVGVGMAFPYVVLACNPRLVHLLPRPGAWTLRLEQLLGFFLIGTVVYLASLLPERWMPAFLFILFAVALACWLWGQIGHLGASTLRRITARTCAVLLVFFAVWWGGHSISDDPTWEPFDAQTFTELLGKQPLLLEFTADWCPSCKALEYTTLNKTRMADLRRRYNLRTIRVDLTRDEGQGRLGKELLKALDSTSIPVLALFPAGQGARQPVVLRDLVTPAQLESAAAAAFSDDAPDRYRRSNPLQTVLPGTGLSLPEPSHP